MTLGKKLVLDELFDLTLYRRMHGIVSPELKRTLDELISIETTHYAFWQKFFKMDLTELDMTRRIKLEAIVLGIRIFGDTGAHLMLEAIEIHGVRKYLDVWKIYKDTPVGEALRGILEDEFRHEDMVVSEAIKKRIHPERIRDIFLGFNDGMVEILGAVVGFLAAFKDTNTVIAASITVATAGALSMAAGAYASTNSEREVEQMDRDKNAFLGQADDLEEAGHPFASAVIVGVSYLFGSLVSVLPIAFGFTSVWSPIVAALIITVLVSGFISFLSGMRTSRRIALNLATIAIAVSITYIIGLIARSVWNITV